MPRNDGVELRWKSDAMETPHWHRDHRQNAYADGLQKRLGPVLAIVKGRGLQV